MNIHEARKLKEKMARYAECDEQAHNCSRAISTLYNASHHNVMAIEIPCRGGSIKLPAIGMTAKELGEVLMPLYEKYRDKLLKEMEEM